MDQELLHCHQEYELASRTCLMSRSRLESAWQRGPIFFGYTTCPDLRLLTKANLTRMLGILGAGAGRNRVSMITTDPAKYTGEPLAGSLGKFNAAFLGLTDSPAHLARMSNACAVTVVDGGGRHGDYVHMVDTSGNLVEILSPSIGAADLARDVSLGLKGN